jgi:hypothetical protein
MDRFQSEQTRIEMWRKELAISLFAQLPESAADKRLVIDLMIQLLEWTSQDAPEGSVVPFRAAGTSPNS